MPEQSVRDRILDALLELTATRGAEGVTVREVAAAVGVSIGSVQYYCRSKEEMLTMAFDEVNRRILERVARIDRDGKVGTVLRRAVLEFLPLDDARRLEAAVYLAYSTRAVVSPGLSAVRQELIREQHGLCADAYRLARQRGQHTGHFDPDAFAWTTVALVDGLLLNLLSTPGELTAGQAIDVVDRHLSSVIEID